MDPSQQQDTLFELYSVPSHEGRRPEIVAGRQIGSTKQYVAPGDVLISKINPRLNRAWVVGDFSEHPKIASTEWIVFPRSNNIDSKFLSLLLQDWRIRDHLAHNVSGVGGSLMRVKAAVFDGIAIGFPPLNEQRRIVAKIEELFSELDAGVEGLKKAREQLKVYRQALLKHAFEGKLTAAWREQNAHWVEAADVLWARVLRERRAQWETEQLARYAAAGVSPPQGWQTRYKEPVGPDLTDPPEVPTGWFLESMDALTRVITSGPRNWSPYYDRGDGVFLMAQNVRPGRLDLSYLQRVDPPAEDPGVERSQVECADLLVTIVGANTGDVCLVDRPLPRHYVCQSVALMRPVLAALASYLLHYLTSQENGQRQYRRYIYGAGRPHLSFDQLKNTPVILPPLAEQEQIVAMIENRMSFIDSLADEIDTALHRAEALRQSILKRAFSGRLVPQDPHDEPASVLLERIRAEKAAAGNGKPTRRVRADEALTIPDKPQRPQQKYVTSEPSDE